MTKGVARPVLATPILLPTLNLASHHILGGASKEIRTDDDDDDDDEDGEDDIGYQWMGKSARGNPS